MAEVTRYDKTDPYGSTHRAPLAVNWDNTNANKIVGVGINSSGALVIGAGQTGIIGVIVLPVGKKNDGTLFNGPVAGTPVDFITDGEVLNFKATLSGAAAGTKYFAATNGVISTTNTGTPVGYTIEADRFIVHVKPLFA